MESRQDLTIPWVLIFGEPKAFDSLTFHTYMGEWPLDTS